MIGDCSAPIGIQFLELRFDAIDQVGAANCISEFANAGRFSYVVTPNVDHVVRLHDHREDQALWSSYRKASLSLCDSRILLALGRLSDVNLSLVPGSDFTVELLDADLQIQNVAIIGGDAQLGMELSIRFPKFNWHQHLPPDGVLYNPVAQLEIIDFIEECPATLYFFAIGSPQSELLCARIAERGRARGVALCIGASLEFVTGAKSRAPVWMQKCGLEWLFRLLKEPRRLWRRYLIDGPRIFAIWWRWRLKASH